MFGRFVLGAVLALGVLGVSEVQAQGKQNFSLLNKTGYTIQEIYVSPSKSDDWAEDVMGQDVLESGKRVTITFPKRVNTCKWDIKVVYDDSDEAEWEDFNLCEVSKITLLYNRKTGETSAEYE